MSRRNPSKIPYVKVGEFDIKADRVNLEGALYYDKLYVILNEYGPLGALFADNEQDALDELIDLGLGQGLLVDQEYAEEMERDYGGEGIAYAGNAGEPISTLNLGIERIPKKQWSRVLTSAVNYVNSLGSGEVSYEYPRRYRRRGLTGTRKVVLPKTLLDVVKLPVNQWY